MSEVNRRKIVVLDGYTLNPGDNPWTPLEELGDLTVYNRTSPADVADRCSGADIVLTNKTVIGEDLMERLPGLLYIGVLATGYNVVDVKAANARGIAVTNVPTYGTDSVAEMTLAHIFELTKGVGIHDRFVHEGGWCTCPDYSVTVWKQRELQDMTLGIIGLGRIGRRVAEMAIALGMNVLACNRSPVPPVEGRFAFADTDTLLDRSDILSLHCPANESTIGMVDGAFLAKMKKDAFLINTARGQLIVEDALANALNTGIIAGAALDVLSEEPPKSNVLLKAKNCIITPHIAWATPEARRRLMLCAAENIRAFMDGKELNRIK